jgi:hypothetical protein
MSARSDAFVRFSGWSSHYKSLPPAVAEAVKRDDREAVERAFWAGISPNDYDECSRSVLALAVLHRARRVFELVNHDNVILDAEEPDGTYRLKVIPGANPDAYDENFDTPLMHAARLGEVDFADRLLERGASTAFRNNDQDNAREIALNGNYADIAVLTHRAEQRRNIQR